MGRVALPKHARQVTPALGYRVERKGLDDSLIGLLVVLSSDFLIVSYSVRIALLFLLQAGTTVSLKLTHSPVTRMLAVTAFVIG